MTNPIGQATGLGIENEHAPQIEYCCDPIVQLTRFWWVSVREVACKHCLFSQNRKLAT